MAGHLQQFPPPGGRLVRHAGDELTIVLESPEPLRGRVRLRTNLRHAARRRAAVIACVERGEPVPSDDWEDLPMVIGPPNRATITLPLTDPGVFGAKAYVLADDQAAPVWPEGDGNLIIKVEPAWTVARNSIYSAFVRMFREKPEAEWSDEDLRPLDDAGYTVIPPSGTFRRLAGRLDHILGDMGFRIILLLPPFPVPATYARMGRYGSPFAPRDYYDVDPALAEFDRRTTPLDQFQELADGIHSRGGRLFIDVPINHTGWASRLIAEHPEWFCRNPDGTFQSPGAWGVTWADLVKLDYAHRGLWLEMAEVFLFWCRRGVDGFRCDAGYMVPVPVWEYIAAKVRSAFPDTVFLLEGLGGPVETTLELLGGGGLNWAYSELFQNFDRGAVDWYLPQAVEQSAAHGLQIHFAETHDNNRLAAKSPRFARMRTALAALTSSAGGWGITCGVEWFATAKIRVHGATDLNEHAPENQVAEIARLNALMDHPAFHAGAAVALITRSEGSGIAVRRTPPDDSPPVLVLINLDDECEAAVSWDAADFPDAGAICLLTGARLQAARDGDRLSVVLPPAAAGCYAPAESAAAAGPSTAGPPLTDSQAAAALARRIAASFRASVPPAAPPITDDPAGFCQAVSGLPYAPVTRVTWPRDSRRNVVWLPGDWLLVTADSPFRWHLRTPEAESAGESLAGREGAFALLPPPRESGVPATLSLRLIDRDRMTRGIVELAIPGALTEPDASATGGEIRADPEKHVVLANGSGAMAHIRAAWGTLQSQYDSLLAANLSDSHPTDRRVIFTRCRAWVVRRGFSTELSAAWTTRVRMISGECAQWDFEVPCGDGHRVRLAVRVHLQRHANAVALTFERLPGDDAGAVSLILRPDVEDRGFHEKWHLGPADMEVLDSVTRCEPRRFVLPCHDGELWVDASAGSFVHEPERLTVEHPADARRGLGGYSTLFSPGWFGLPLAPSELLCLSAVLVPRGYFSPPFFPLPVPQAPSFPPREAIRQFIVRRDETLTVIAGYPWFLDWGRDTLICLRGIAAAGETDAVRSILRTFARLERDGTLPNMIRGADDSNRSTSDAPLWFLVATADLLQRDGSDAFLEERVGPRTIRDVLISIGRHYRDGTPIGVRMDPESGLIFSPSHFTWMDTNFPAGSPREGYPICIQALWYAGLKLLSRIDDDPAWPQLADQVRQSIHRHFVRPDGWLADCLHAAPGCPAAEATADDHLRPNQLLAITLGAVRDPALRKAILTHSLELLVPGALRTLADRPVRIPLPVLRDGVLLNDPHHPFQPFYRGDEDTQRKPAYHNGTAWPWLMPMLAEAMLLSWGPAARARAEGVLASSLPLFRRFCLGHLEEIRDGGIPHRPGGCGAQAWSITEWVRVRQLLRALPPSHPDDSAKKTPS